MATKNLGRVFGYSAYEVAVNNDYEGTEEEWLQEIEHNKEISSIDLITNLEGKTIIKIGMVGSCSRGNVSTYGTFWLTNIDEMVALRGRTLKSITLLGWGTGQVTFYGSNTIIDKNETTANMSTACATANGNKEVLFKINVQAGLNTYMLDGTDDRVTLESEEVVCPNSIGFVDKDNDTGKLGYNFTLIDNTYSSFAWQNMTADTKTSTLAMDFECEYDENYITETVKKEKIKITYADGSTTEVDKDTSVKPLKGKKISFLGDSITTFRGQLPNDNYATYYPQGYLLDLNKTWWKMLINEEELTLVRNASWSGSTVTGDSTSTDNAFAGCSTARINDLSDGTNNPDIIVCYIGINDFGNTYLRALGSFDGRQAIPEEGTIETFSEAYALMLYKIMNKYPKARVYCCTLLEVGKSNFDGQDPNVFPAINNNGAILEDYNARIRTVAKALGCRVIELHECGINFWNLNKYTGELLHPNYYGHEKIKECVRTALLEDFKD